MSDNNTTQTNAVAVIMPNLFQDINFTGLDTAIQALGNSSNQLSDNEKQNAVGIIDNWEKNVINRLELKQQDADRFLSTLNVQDNAIYIETDELEAIVNAVGSGAIIAYDTMRAKKYDLDDVIADKPEKFIPDLDTTTEEKLTQDCAFELETQKYTIRVAKARNEAVRAIKNLKIELNKDPNITELASRLAKFKRNIRKFTLDCKEKSELAKINVTISSDDVRTALKELLDFSVSF